MDIEEPEENKTQPQETKNNLLKYFQTKSQKKDAS